MQVIHVCRTDVLKIHVQAAKETYASPSLKTCSILMGQIFKALQCGATSNYLLVLLYKDDCTQSVILKGISRCSRLQPG